MIDLPAAPLRDHVDNISDSELVRRAVRTCRGKRRGPRWVAVMEMFGLGSTYAHQLCRKHGLDPDEKV